MRRIVLIMMLAALLVLVLAVPAFAPNNAVSHDPGNSGGVCFIVNHNAGGPTGINTAAAANGRFIVDHGGAC